MCYYTEQRPEPVDMGLDNQIDKYLIREINHKI